MRAIKCVLWCGLVLAFAGCASKDGGQGVKRAGNAVVRAVHGEAQFSIGGGKMEALLPNTELPEGATVQTEADGQVDLQVNGRTSTVRVTAGTTMILKKMDAFGPTMMPDTETVLFLKSGLVLGSVKKISAPSRYEVSTPRGVVYIRGTDFAVLLTPHGKGLATVTFTCVTGQIVCVANVVTRQGFVTPVTKILLSGQSWTPPERDAGL